MAKEITKLFNKMKDELKAELKLHRETMERNFHLEKCTLRTKLEIKTSLDFALRDLMKQANLSHLL